MMIQKKIILSAFCLSLLVGGCAQQSTPSMMNTSMPELHTETHLEQIPASEINDVSISILASQYKKYGDGPLELTMTYDSKSRTNTAMKALHRLKKIEEGLAKKGITNVKMDTLALDGETSSLMVLYPSVHASSPSDCGAMPGLTNNLTDRELGDYRFGCGVESMLARQIARPGDLRGRGADVMGVNDGRRITNVMETYHTLNDRQARGELGETLERDNLAAE